MKLLIDVRLIDLIDLDDLDDLCRRLDGCCGGPWGSELR